MPDPLEELRAAMADAGMPCDYVIADGKIHRFKAPGEKKPNSWYVFYGQGGAFGNWRTGEQHKWSWGAEGLVRPRSASSVLRVQRAMPIKPEVFEFTGANLLVALEEIVVELYQALGNNEQANKYFMFECVDIIKYVLSGALREDFRITTIEEPALGWISGYMAERKKWREERELRQWAESMEHQLALAYSGQADDDEIPF